MDCKYDSGKGASFNLNALRDRSAQAYTMQDRIQSSEKDYLYTFGICKAVQPPANCLRDNGDARTRYFWSPAWQTKSSETPSHDGSNNENLLCHYLGAPTHTNHEWSIDERDPAKGVTLTYTGGQHCTRKDPATGQAMQRRFAINFQCAPKTPEKIEQLIIDESSHCEYDITIDSEYACPSECGLEQTGAVCGAHGICGYDSDQGRARCYCNGGRQGDFCTEEAKAEEEDTNGPIVGLMVFVAIMVVLILGMLVMLWRFMQSRKVEAMGDVYHSLHNDFSNPATEIFEIERVEMGSSEPVFPMPSTGDSARDTKFEQVASQL